MKERYEKLRQRLSELYIEINKGEFTFPEFDGQSKKNKKENSLKALSLMQRYLRSLEGEDEDTDNFRQTS